MFSVFFYFLPFLGIFYAYPPRFSISILTYFKLLFLTPSEFSYSKYNFDPTSKKNSRIFGFGMLLSSSNGSAVNGSVQKPKVMGSKLVDDV